MGFYGNVYYQLINSFYKLVGNNNGQNIKDYSEDNAISTDELKNDIATEAVGRLGVINLDTGNYWIGITEGDKVDGLEIVHMPPTTSNTTLVKGVDYLGTEKTEETADAIEMDAGGYIKTHEIQYDSAGHVASKEEKIYKLPKPEVTDRIQNLEVLVGLKSDGSVYPDSKTQTLHGFVSDNFSNVSTLKEYVGNWSNICDYWSDSSLGGKITVQQAIGKLDDLFSNDFGMNGSYYQNKNNWNGLTGVIGPVNKLWHAYDSDNNTPISLVNTLLKQKEANQDTLDIVTLNHNTVQGQIRGINATIGSQLNTDKTVFEEISLLKEKDDSILDILNWTDTDKTVSGEIVNIVDTLDWDEETETVKNKITALETDNDKLFGILGVNKEEEYTQEDLVSRLSTAEVQLINTQNKLVDILGVNDNNSSKVETNEDGSIKVNILDQIFNSIEEIKGDISQISLDINSIKQKMNELHSDNPPFSDDSNTGEEEI